MATKKKPPLTSSLDFLKNLKGTSVNARNAEIDISSIDPDPNQPRDTFAPVDGQVDPYSLEALNELADSIEAEGIHQSPSVRPHPTVAGRYMIVMGERRYRACKILAERGNAKFLKIECKIVESNDPKAIRLSQLTENIQREDLTDIQIARFIKSLLDEYPDLQKQELGKILNKNSQYISRILALVDARWSHVVDAGIITYASLLDQFKALPEEKQKILVDTAKAEGRPLTVTDLRSAKKEQESENLERIQSAAQVPSVPSSSGNTVGGAPVDLAMAAKVQELLDAEASKVPDAYEYKGERRDKQVASPVIHDRGGDADLPTSPIHVSMQTFAKLPVKLTIEQLAIVTEKSLLPQDLVVEATIDIATVQKLIQSFGSELPSDDTQLASVLIKAINKAGK